MSTLYKELEHQSEMSETGNQKEHWDMVIEPKTALFDLQLKEVWRYRDLMILFVKRDFVAQYKQTILGPLWHIVQPVFTTVMFLFLFSKVAKIPTDGIEPTLFYMSGITIWNYFSTCLTATSSTFVTNANIFGKVYFPRLVLPLSVVISNIVKLGIQFGLLLVVMVYYSFKGEFAFHINMSLLLLPFIIITMAGLGLGLGIIISSITTKYRDFTVLLGFVVQLAMYATPIAYPLSYLKEGSTMRMLLNINPITPLVESFRYALFGHGAFTAGTLLYSAAFMMAVLFFGIIMFNKVEKSFMDTV